MGLRLRNAIGPTLYSPSVHKRQRSICHTQKTDDTLYKLSLSLLHTLSLEICVKSTSIFDFEGHTGKEQKKELVKCHVTDGIVLHERNGVLHKKWWKLPQTMFFPLVCPLLLSSSSSSSSCPPPIILLHSNTQSAQTFS